MRLLPGRQSGSPSDTSHISLLLEKGAGALESALDRVVRGSVEEIEGVVIREIGRARVSLMPLRDIEGKSGGAVLLIYPEQKPQDASPGLLDSVDTVYEIDLQTGRIRVLSGHEHVDRYYPGSSELTIQSWEAALHPEDRERALAARKALVEEGRPLDESYRIQTAEGGYEWVHDRCIRVGDAEGNLFQIGVTRLSLEEPRRRELSGREDQRILDATQELVTYLEPDLRIRWANKAAAAAAGMDAKEMAGRRCYEVWQGRDTPCDNCPVARAAESRSPEEGEVTTPDGRRFLIRSYPITDTLGTLLGLVEFGRDISLQHQTEEALRKTAGLLESILENSPFPISVLDTEGRYVMVNQATTKLYSLPRETLLGHHLTEFLPDETGYVFDRRIHRLVKEKRPVTVEDEISKGDEIGVFYTTLFPIWGDDGEISAIGGITTDVTELRTAQELAERADAQKSSLLQEVHARVRGNLQVISDLIQVDHRSKVPRETADLLRRTQVRLRAMSLVYEQNDDAEPLGAVDLVTYAQSLVNEVIQAYECESNVSLSLWADPVVVPLDFGLSFGLVLAELISNICLIAFVPHQGGLLEVAISDDNQAITLRVTDGSPGTQDRDAGEQRALVTLGNLVQQFRGAIQLDVGDPRTWEVTLPLAPEDRI
jgi:PAS domain S-box-containing protein